jgi:Tfp pilus assembly protein PilF
MVAYLYYNKIKNQKLYMNKLIIIVILIITSVTTFAQNNVENAYAALAKNDFYNAKKEIDAAVSSEGNKPKSTTQLMKAYIYQSIAGDDKNKSLAPDGLEVALAAFKNYFSLEKKIEPTALTDVTANVKNNVIINYNNAINAYNAQKYDDAIRYFKNIEEATKLNEGKLFVTDKGMDTIKLQAKSYEGYSQLFNKNTSEAKNIFESLQDNKIVVDADMILRLAQIYQGNNDNDKWISTLEKGRKLFPSEKAFVNEELNYYILTNKTDILAVKLEEAVKGDPNNAELNYSLGTTYDALLAKEGNSDINTKKYTDGAIKAYETAIKIDATKGDYIYNLGALYFNQAAKVSKAIVATKDTKKQKELDLVKKGLFKNCLPHFEKAMKIYETGGAVKDYDRQNYFNTLTALNAIYSDSKQKTLEDEINKKMAKFK